ncbi:PHO85 cyclin-5 [Elasticomyces elasticus]|uniref:PHO85 cyclin-5 n=1 Tax=Exophiala sideris TaxID=1016849 RepID=A0ABR0JL00_9EURO|nr:PHO85 cyclin-5 [Elasticomyces elasticus]KAK5032289.1 PHO85 cyclin-5 [Exophiala sideris]KAK5036287.1 PHO85 cyclin-5 [Exophiala sideris]KAK5066670.1 PHO85 cyclin-5 [Exophiala sideris]KAK5180492.1 PHO85 cyclin-5 [Eurotiomycetes sp. CCFEE 6388]
MGLGPAVAPSDLYQRQKVESINGWLSAQEPTLQSLRQPVKRSTSGKHVTTIPIKCEDNTPTAPCGLKTNALLGAIASRTAGSVCGYAKKEVVARPRGISCHDGLPVQCKNKQDFDQGSIVSFDDDVSITDSAHDSQSSESSTSSSWTNATEPTEHSQSDDTKGQPPAGHLELCSSPSESSEQLFKHLEAKDDRHCSNSSSSDQYCDSVKSFSSATSQPESLDESTFLPYALPQSSSDGLARRSNSRRPTASTKSLSGPCRLKRDTDGTENFVSLLIIFATRLITAIWPMSACPPMTSTCFNGAGVLPLRVFIQETLRRSKSSYSTLQVALYYLILLKAKLSCRSQNTDSDGEHGSERSRCRAMQCGRRMFLSALMLASKYLQDRNYSARAWSKISGLRSNEINENERNYLQMIDYELHVPKEYFDVWSKIVLSLSQLSREKPRCQPGSPDSSGYSSPGTGSSNSLADMVSQVDLEEPSGHRVFSDSWWCGLIKQLDPHLVKDTNLAAEFLRKHLPQDDVDHVASWTFDKTPSPPTSPESASGLYDMNFSDTLKPRSGEVSQACTSRTPTQPSPASTTELPMRPHLGNLPTPQTTPRVAENCALPAISKPSLRCSASVDALRNMRRQCFTNANLDRCPPPRPQGCPLPSMRSLLRPAETFRENSSRSTTPCTSSPLSVITETTPGLTSRSRSSSISSNSSWTSPMRLRGELANSSLGRSCSSSHERGRLGSAISARMSDSFNIRSSDDDDSSGEELPTKAVAHQLATTSEVDAAQLLLSLSAHSETSSQSTTPTPQRLSEQGVLAVQANSDSPRGHKRSLSKVDHNLQAQVKSTLAAGFTSCEVVEDPVQPFYDTNPKQWLVPTKSWAGPRRALPNLTDNKRRATYCSIQQFTSAADLAARYLKESMTTAP